MTLTSPRAACFTEVLVTADKKIFMQVLPAFKFIKHDLKLKTFYLNTKYFPYIRIVRRSFVFHELTFLQAC